MMFSIPLKKNTKHGMNKISAIPVALIGLLLSVMLTACGDKPQSQTSLANDGAGLDEYKGPPPNSEDVQKFRIEFWENLRGANRCGTCHGTNGQYPQFVDSEDINRAYDNAKLFVNVETPVDSTFVAQVGKGHHCWIENDNRACADIMERYISRWLGVSASAGKAIVLTAPPIYDPGSSKSFPLLATDLGANSFSNTVYPLLRTHCNGCHSEDAATRQAPFFASGDVAAAYQAARAKMDLNTPANSRFVLRLGQEFHNCWTSVCTDDAADMEAAINAFAGAIVPTQVDPALITSKALKLPEAILASGGRRFEDNAIALWEFKSGSGTTAIDYINGVNLTFTPDSQGQKDITWVNGYGVDIKQGYLRSNSSVDTVKLYEQIVQSGEYALETWVVPANVTQEDSSIISYNIGLENRNFTMGQTLYNYDFINQSSRASGNAASKLMTNDDDRDLQASLQHVVMNFDPINGRQIYVNGVSTGDSDTVALKGGTVDWRNNYVLTFGNEVGGALASQWKGKLRLVAIHKRILTPEQIRQNFTAGVGQKYYMLFSVQHLIDNTVTDKNLSAYIMFEVEQYDNYSYLFNAPKFINLDPNWTPSSAIPIKGIRIGINGKEAVAGQAFANIDTQVTAAQYTPDGQTLSSIGTIITAEQGFDLDEFFLTFEQIGANTHTVTEADPVVPTPQPDADAVSDIGVRTFDEINATMAAITGIPVTNASVSTAFDLTRRQLPASEDIEAFMSSQQMAIAQLALKYCDQLVEINSGYFTGFNMTAPAATAFDTQTKRDQIVTPLLQAIMNVGSNTPDTQPDEATIRSFLSSDTAQDLDASLNGDSFNSIMDCMTRCARGLPMCSIAGTTPSCGATSQNTAARTREVVKATCAAMLGSSAMLIQ
jgi:hypothetical protein